MVYFWFPLYSNETLGNLFDLSSPVKANYRVNPSETLNLESITLTLAEIDDFDVDSFLSQKGKVTRCLIIFT